MRALALLTIAFFAQPVFGFQIPVNMTGAAFDQVGTLVLIGSGPPCRLFYPDSAPLQNWLVTGSAITGHASGDRLRVVGVVGSGVQPISCSAQPPFSAVAVAFVEAVNWMTYCTGAVNSTGEESYIGALGSDSVALANLRLTAAGLPPVQPGLFYYGPTQTQIAFGNGFRCVTGPPGEVYRLFPFALSDATGAVDYPLDFAGAPSGALLAGSVWNYQFWYRDPAAGGAGFNLTNGVSVLFSP